MHTQHVNEAQMVLFQIARKNASDHDENIVNSNRALSKSLADKTLKEAKVLRPDIDSKIWSEAAANLANM